MAKVNGIALAGLATGVLFAYSGIKGKSITATLQYVIQGKNPAGSPAANPITGTGAASGGAVTAEGGNPGGGSDQANQAMGRLMAAAYGWGAGAEWTALNNIVMAESGWSSTITNASSGAAGIAQNISGFGTGYESGNAPQQIAWLLSYIKQRYGDPVAAWNFHLANGWY